MRDLVFEKKDYKGADELCRFMQGPYTQAYEPLGDLLIDLDHGPEVTGYRRELKLDEAVATVSSEVSGVMYRREVYASAPAQVVMVKLSCSKAGGLNGKVSLRSALRSNVGAWGTGSGVVHQCALGRERARPGPRLCGQADDHAVAAAAVSDWRMRTVAGVVGGFEENQPGQRHMAQLYPFIRAERSRREIGLSYGRQQRSL